MFAIVINSKLTSLCFKDRVCLIRFVSEAAALSLPQNQQRALSLLKDQQEENSCPPGTAIVLLVKLYFL
jgi:hypothetical protein